ncbi:MAG: thermonuclease family protein [Thioalkalispiraceae bacterium]|jgi:endonuclease YncB( thermonuclease family)
MEIIKRVLVAVPFFCLALAHAANAECRSTYYDETVSVDKVYDGDTVRLADQRKIRIIGINTPERARDDKPAEPYALQASQALQQLLHNQPRVKIRYGKEKHDRYGRLLAHVFLTDGRNLTELLLRQGMGLALTVPPNLWRYECYQRAEQSARQAGAGLWQHPRYQAVDVKQLAPQQQGYYRVTGTVQRIGESRSAYWLNLSNDFALKINKSDQHYFIAPGIDDLKGTTLVARGWIYERQYRGHRQKRMRIRHPAALNVVK